MPYSSFSGLNLGIEKRYTFIVKDDIPQQETANSREQATISWECDFELPPQDKPGETHDKTVFLPWEAFNPTYRGKLQKDADPLDKAKIKRFSIMIRSFFGAQEGDFSLYIRRIKAVCEAPPPGDDTTARNVIDSNTPNLRQLEEGRTVAGRAEKDLPDQSQTSYSVTDQLPKGAIAV